ASSGASRRGRAISGRGRGRAGGPVRRRGCRRGGAARRPPRAPPGPAPPSKRATRKPPAAPKKRRRVEAGAKKGGGAARGSRRGQEGLVAAIPKLPEGSPAHKRVLARYDEQEARVEKLQTLIAEKKAAERKEQEEYETAALTLTVN